MATQGSSGNANHADADDRGHRGAALGFLVLLLTSLLSNAGSLPIVPGDAFDQRLASHLVRELGGVGYFGQLGAGVWLALALIFDARRGTRFAFGAWLVALCLYSAPVPTLFADLALAPALLVAAGLLALLTRALDRATRLDEA
ncbi:MAG: hypothetical protein ABSB58_03010 [Gemmatimonadales bacterium]|jgi:hypothetical protein